MASVQPPNPQSSSFALPGFLEGQSILITKGISTFIWVWSDKGSGADKDVTIYSPAVNPDWKDWMIIGHVAWPGYDPPAGATAILVKELNASADSPILTPPQAWTSVWTDRGSGGKHDGSIWFPVPPAGYRTLGYVATLGYEQPDLPSYRCVREDFCEQAGFGPVIWSDKGSGADEDVTIWQIDESPFFYARRTHGGPAGEIYRLKDAFIPGN